MLLKFSQPEAAFVPPTKASLPPPPLQVSPPPPPPPRVSEASQGRSRYRGHPGPSSLLGPASPVIVSPASEPLTFSSSEKVLAGGFAAGLLVGQVDISADRTREDRCIGTLAALERVRSASAVQHVVAAVAAEQVVAGDALQVVATAVAADDIVAASAGNGVGEVIADLRCNGPPAALTELVGSDVAANPEYGVAAGDAWIARAALVGGCRAVGVVALVDSDAAERQGAGFGRAAVVLQGSEVGVGVQVAGLGEAG